MTPCFTNSYFSGKHFNYKIILEFLNEYYEAKIPYKSLFFVTILREGYTVQFFFWAFHAIQFQGHFMKHEILSRNTFGLTSKFNCLCFSSITKLCSQRKMCSDSENLITLNFDKWYLLLVKQKKLKRPKRIWKKPWL